MGYSLGVDLGTTFTAAAVADAGHAEIVPLGDRSPQAPSVVYKTIDGSFRYGEAAERHAAAEPERIAREFKRRIGDRTPVFVAGSPMSAHALSKALLGWTVEQVIAGQGVAPDRVVVTCPANWGPYRRELMSQVTALNGDYPIEVRSEPEAAAVHFATSRRVAIGEAIAVYDLGGGTFDAAVLRRTSEYGFELLGPPDGIEQLGGVDFDEAVFERVGRGIDWDRLDAEDPETLAGLARLRRDCTEAKEALSSETETTVSVLLGGRPTRVRLTRAEFEELISPLVGDTMEILERVIRRSGVTVDGLAAIVLVGGSTRVPLINEMITARFHRPAVLSPQPKLCVAMGAALLAAAPALQASRVDALGSVTAGGWATGSGSIAVEPPGPEPLTDEAPASGTTSAKDNATERSDSETVRSEPIGREQRTADPLRPDPSGSEASTRQPSRPESSGLEASRPALSGRRSHRPVYPLVAAGFAVAALLLMIIGPHVDTAQARTWNTAFDVVARGAPATATLTPTLLGIPLTQHPEPAADGTFHLSNNRLFLAGPLRATYADPKASRQVVIKAAHRWSWQRFVTIQFAALVLTTLFSFAYAESILRTIRRRRTRATPGELTGLVGSGLVAGIAAVLATWVLGDRLPQVATCLGIVVCVCAAIGLLAFAWPARDEHAAR